MAQGSFPLSPPPEMHHDTRPTLPKSSVPAPHPATKAPHNTATTTVNGIASTLSKPKVDLAQSASVTQIMEALETSVRALKTQADEQLTASVSSRDQLRSDLEEVDRRINEHNRHYQQHLEETQQDLDSKLRAKIEDAYKTQLQKSIAKGVKAQAPEHVQRLITAAIGPISLKQQLEEIKQRKSKLIDELLNSKARSANNGLVDKSYINDPIRPILVHGIGKSKLFPSSISSFICYNDEQMQRLFEHYNLGNPSSNRNANMSRFLAYIGVPFKVEVDAPGPGLPTPTSPVTGKPSGIGRAHV